MVKVEADDMSGALLPRNASLLESPGRQVISVTANLHDMHNHGACEVDRVWMLCVRQSGRPC